MRESPINGSIFKGLQDNLDGHCHSTEETSLQFVKGVVLIQETVVTLYKL